MKKFIVNIWAYDHHAKFDVLSLDDPQSLEDAILDKLGENVIKWEENDLQYTSTVNDFYITYEEVNNGSAKDGVVSEENTVRV